MNGQVNSQNVRKYAPKGNNPEFTYEVSLSKEKCMVWMGLCGNGTVLGPFFLDNSVNRNPKNSGRKRSGRSEDNIDAMHDELI